VLTRGRTSGRVATRVAERSPGEDDERLPLGTEVAIPPARGEQRPFERIGETRYVIVVHLEIEKRPRAWLARLDVSYVSARDPGDLQGHAVEHGADAQALGDETSGSRHDEPV